MEEGSEDGEETWNLDTIPIEIFLHISTFIPSKFLLKSMALVSKHFYEILKNEQTWKIRQNKMFQPSFPPVHQETLPLHFWRQSCLAQEETQNLFLSPSQSEIIELHSHIACIDSVHLFKGNRYLATGSRDRSICLWDIDKALDNVDNAKVYQKHAAHKGWIWAFQTIQDFLVSASWDNFVKIWDQNFDTVSEFKCPSACLCLASEENIIACGTFNKKVIFFDTRVKSEVFSYTAHKQCVLSIGMEQNYLVSCGEDSKVALFDRRTNSISNSFMVPQTGQTSKNYPKSCSYGKTDYPLNLCYVGDIKGNVHLIDLKTFTISKTYSQVHNRAVQGVFMTLGSVITCSKDGQMNVHEPSRKLKLIKSIHFPGVELPQVHSLNNRVALAGGDSIVRVWRGLNSLVP